MAFLTIPTADIQVGKPTKKSLWQKIKDNFDNHESRIAALSAGANKVLLMEYNISPSDLDIGKIVSANMTLSQFVAIHGTGWILADGGSASGSIYAAVTGATVVPDLRKQFLRGAGTGVVQGTAYADSTAVNGLSASSSSNSTGAHTHTLDSVYAPSGSSSGSTKNAKYDAGNPIANTTSSNGAHSHTITTTLSGDAETRPQNFGVNFFIKINLSAQDNIISLKVRENSTIVSALGYIIDNNGLGTSGNFEFDLKKSSTDRASLVSIYSTNPTLSATGVSDGDNTSVGTLVAGGASLTAGDWLTLDITSLMPGQSGIYIQVFAEPA